MPKNRSVTDIVERVTVNYRSFRHEHLDQISDRHNVIVYGAKMDELLGRALQSKLLPSVRGNDDDELLESDRALGTFSARINAAYRLGLIDESMRKALHTFRKIRNNFAHDLDAKSVSVPPYQDMIRDWVEPLKGATYDELRSNHSSHDETQQQFLIAVGLIVVTLDALGDRISRIDPGPAFSFSMP